MESSLFLFTFVTQVTREEIITNIIKSVMAKQKKSSKLVIRPSKNPSKLEVSPYTVPQENPHNSGAMSTVKYTSPALTPIKGGLAGNKPYLTGRLGLGLNDSSKDIQLGITSIGPKTPGKVATDSYANLGYNTENGLNANAGWNTRLNFGNAANLRKPGDVNAYMGVSPQISVGKKLDVSVPLTAGLEYKPSKLPLSLFTKASYSPQIAQRMSGKFNPDEKFTVEAGLKLNIPNLKIKKNAKPKTNPSTIPETNWVNSSLKALGGPINTNMPISTELGNLPELEAINSSKLNTENTMTHEEWLAYGQANKFFAANGLDLSKLATTVGAQGASATDVTAANPTIPYAALGALGSSLVGGDTNIADNREKGLAEGTLGGILQGAGQGAGLGSMFGLPGTVIGAVGGAIVGGVKGNKDKQAEIDAFKNNMELKASQMDLTGTTAMAAYGADLGLPDMGLGGEPTDYNGNTHEEGGLDLGKVEVEDGEIRVGDYVFSDRLIDPETGKTYAQLAKKITGKFTEYENDGPSKRTQSKQLEGIKAKNDAARALQEAQDAEMQANLEQDYAAYGAMITKDPAGKYMVDKSNRMDLMEAAKGRGMSYNSYVDKLFACGGNMKKKMATGGEFPTPEELLNNLNQAGLIDDGLSLDAFTGMGDSGSTAMPTDFSSVVEPGKDASAPTLGFSTPYSEYSDFNSLDPNTASMAMSMVQPKADPTDPKTSDLDMQLPTRGLPTDLAGLEVRKTIQPGASGADTSKMSPEQYMQMLKKNFGTDEKALLASNLPAMANLMNARNQGMDSFNRVDLNEVDMSNERAAIKEAIARAKDTNRANVRGTATSSGEALAALSAGSAGLTNRELDALSSSYANESNANTQIRNQESLTNTDISNQEMVARLQDQALRDSVRNLALSDMGSNVQGYMKDKSLEKENVFQNNMIMSLMKTGEYELANDEKGNLTVKYIGPKSAPKTETK